jgi:hypothetical protein
VKSGDCARAEGSAARKSIAKNRPWARWRLGVNFKLDLSDSDLSMSGFQFN